MTRKTNERLYVPHRRQERHRIHQVFASPAGTRIMARIREEDGTDTWEARPVLFFALIEDLEEGGDRILVPMAETLIDGVLMHTCDDDNYGLLLAPGEPVPDDYEKG